MPEHTIEKYQNFEIEWINVPDFGPHGCGHGVVLYYQDNKQKKLVGFIEGYEWYHRKEGPCKIYILSQDSNEWNELLTESHQILDEIKESAYKVLHRGLIAGHIEGNFYARAHA